MASDDVTRYTVVVRTHGGAGIGLGHLRRCVTLAEALAARGVVVRFVVNEDPSVRGFLRRHAIESVGVPADETADLSRTAGLAAEWGAHALVVDCYDVPGACLSTLGRLVVVVIDDLADRELPVRLVINGGADAGDLIYRVAPATRLLLGPRYCILRAEFGRDTVRSIREAPERVLVTVGGEDSFGLTPRLVAWTREALGMTRIDVVIGPFFTAAVAVEVARLARDNRRVVIHEAPDSMRELMLECDLAVTGGGQTVYELAATGTPALAITMADNQVGGVRALAAMKALAWAAAAGDLDLEARVRKALRDLSDDSRRRAMSDAARRLVDGRGAARAAAAILEACSQ